jgi:hypothetical protein
MKEIELRRYAKCSCCKNLIGQSGVPIFYRITVEAFGLEVRNLQAQTGLAMLLGGNAFLAYAMGADLDMAKPITEKVTLSICQNCWTSSSRAPVMLCGLHDLAAFTPIKMMEDA